MPYPVSSGASASPESFSRTRWYSGRPSSPRGSAASDIPRTLLRVLAEPEPRETPDGDVLADLRTDLVEELLDRLRVVLHEGLIEQHRLLVEGLHLALDDV